MINRMKMGRKEDTMSVDGQTLFGLTTGQAWPWLIGFSVVLTLLSWIVHQRYDVLGVGLFGISGAILIVGLITLAVTLADPYIEKYNANLPLYSRWKITESLPDGTPCWYTVTQVGAYTNEPMNMQIVCSKER